MFVPIIKTQGGWVLSQLVENKIGARVSQGYWSLLLWSFAAPYMFWAAPAHAERLENQVAVFSALDKVTARISKFEVELGKTAVFGSLKVTPRACYSRPETELPKTTTFVEVDEVQLDGQQKRIFTGWMFAESPGLFGVEHPTVDVWLTECQKPANAVAQKAPPVPAQADGSGDPAGDPAATGPAPPDEPAAAPRRRPVRR